MTRALLIAHDGTGVDLEAAGRLADPSVPLEEFTGG
jgi:hypothetical protein